MTITRLFKLAESLGGVKSLLCHPATMTHKSIPHETRLAAGAHDSLIRISCGIEGAAYLVEGVRWALGMTNTRRLQSQVAKAADL